MALTSSMPDPLDSVPDPESVRLMLADATRKRELLRSLLRVAIRKANYPKPTSKMDSSGTPMPEGRGDAR